VLSRTMKVKEGANDVRCSRMTLILDPAQARSHMSKTHMELNMNFADSQAFDLPSLLYYMSQIA
jgi:hypothetical protein